MSSSVTTRSTEAENCAQFHHELHTLMDDFDGDGSPDIILSLPDARAGVILNHGTGRSWASPQVVELAQDGMQHPERVGRIILTADMNGDSAVDAVFIPGGEDQVHATIVLNGGDAGLGGEVGVQVPDGGFVGHGWVSGFGGLSPVFMSGGGSPGTPGHSQPRLLSRA